MHHTSNDHKHKPITVNLWTGHGKIMQPGFSETYISSIILRSGCKIELNELWRLCTRSQYS